MEASPYDGLKGRGEDLVLIRRIDDATNHTLARFYPTATVEAHTDLTGRCGSTAGRWHCTRIGDCQGPAPRFVFFCIFLDRQMGIRKIIVGSRDMHASLGSFDLFP
jgi:hypothetical protein